MPDPRDRRLFDFKSDDDIPYAEDPNADPLDFYPIMARPPAGWRPKPHGSSGGIAGMIALALGVQLLAIPAYLAGGWLGFFPVLICGQLLAALAVGSDSRGRGAETGVWCLVALFFPFAGPIVYLVAKS